MKSDTVCLPVGTEKLVSSHEDPDIVNKEPEPEPAQPSRHYSRFDAQT